jgi:hypothetical protein
MRDERLVVDVSFDEKGGYVASHPELPTIPGHPASPGGGAPHRGSSLVRYFGPPAISPPRALFPLFDRSAK